MRFFIGILLLPFCLHAKPLKVSISAPSAILIDATTGEILYEKNAHMPAYPASVTKIATALYALARKPHDLSAVITSSADAMMYVAPSQRRGPGAKHPPYRLEFGGTKMGIKAGEQVTLNDLLHGLMLPSGNDAANVIAEFVSGSVPKFMHELNGFLKKIGCKETKYYHPHGLPHVHHKTTAHDLAVMTRVAMKNPHFREIVRKERYICPKTNLQEETVLQQHNALVRHGKHHYKHATGVKIGYTLSAGFTIVASAHNGERDLIAVVLNCKEKHQHYQDAVTLFEAAFHEPKMRRTLFSKGFDTFTLKTSEAKGPIRAVLKEDMTLDYFSSMEPEFKTFVHWDKVDFPIEAGGKVGEVRLLGKHKQVIKAQPIFAKEAVDATWGYHWNKISNVKAVVFGVLFCLSILFFIYRREVKAANRK